MQDNEILNQITELTAKINELPKGYISKKSINGKLYFYHQWSENGQKQSKYLKDDEIEVLSEQIALRKELQEHQKILHHILRCLHRQTVISLRLPVPIRTRIRQNSMWMRLQRLH